jgi:ribonuclease-3
VGKELQNTVSQGIKTDSKSQLQELVQSQQQTVVYQLVEMVGPAHSRTFTVEVRAGDRVLGKGTGRSKKSAETDAARSALEQLQSNPTP